MEGKGATSGLADQNPAGKYGSNWVCLNHWIDTRVEAIAIGSKDATFGAPGLTTNGARSYERNKGHRYERSNRTLLAIHFDAKGPTNGLPATQPRVHVGQTREGEGGKRAQAMS